MNEEQLSEEFYDYWHKNFSKEYKTLIKTSTKNKRHSDSLEFISSAFFEFCVDKDYVVVCPELIRLGFNFSNQLYTQLK